MLSVKNHLLKEEQKSLEFLASENQKNHYTLSLKAWAERNGTVFSIKAVTFVSFWECSVISVRRFFGFVLFFW